MTDDALEPGSASQEQGNESTDGEGMIDPRIFIKQLAPDQLGLFEPLSGVMLLNISQQELVDLAGRFTAGTVTDYDRKIIHTINHEAYHFAQVAASGYMFHREARLMMVLNSMEEPSQPEIDPETQAILDAAREDAGDDPELLLRYQQIVAVIEGHNVLARFEQMAQPGDHSVMGALMPAFFAHMKELVDGERVANSDGLSIMGLMEGSAVVHAHQLEHPEEDATPYIEAELETLPPVYRELYDLTVARAGDRALELLLPTVALALRFMQPHNAYLPLLALLAESAPGEAVEYGRALAGQLPHIPEAGHPLGTAIDLRRMHDGYRLYDAILEKLEAGEYGIDSYDFLAQPAAMHAVGTFPLGMVTTDGYLGSLDKTELAARMVLMGAVLRTQSRRRAEREFRDFQAAWARDVFGRLMGEG